VSDPVAGTASRRRGPSALLSALRSGRARWAGTVLLVLFALLIPPLSGVYEQTNPDVSARFTIFLGTSALVLALWSIS
jgi:hypothetical protein